MKGFRLLKLSFRRFLFSHRLVKTRQSPMRILIVRRRLDRRFELLHSVVLAAAIGIQDAQIDMCFRDTRINVNSLFGQRQRVILFAQMNIRVCQICERLRTFRYVRQFCLELRSCFLKLILSPKHIAEKKMCVRRLGVRFYSRAELVHRPLVILHLVERFTRQHIRFGRLGIQVEDLVIGVEDTLILL